MKLSLLELPNEVVRDIVGLLEGRELKALRRCSHRLDELVSPFLFSTLYVSCHQKNLDVFNYIASKPIFLKGVRELVIDDTAVSPALMDKDVFRQMSRHPNLWEKRKLPYFSTENWDEEGRNWTEEADDEFFELLVSTYDGHEENRINERDLAAVMGALGGMTSLRTLVLTNRTADDTPSTGAQSEHNSSPVVKEWREVGRRRRERPPFSPRVEWWHPLQDDEFDGDEMFDMSYLYDGVMELVVNDHHRSQAWEELEDDHDEPTPDDDGQPQDDDEDSIVFSDHDDQSHDGDADLASDIIDNAQTDETVPGDNNTIIPFRPNLLPPTRSLRREARGLRVAVKVLMDPIARARIREFRVDASTDTLADVQTPGLSMRLFDFVSPPFTYWLKTSFNTMNMTKFSLVLSNGREHGAGQELLDQEQVGSILASMPGLTDLSIEGHNLGLIGAIPGNLVFQHLKRASFFCGLVSRLEIRDFIQEHGKTLQELTLGYCSLDGLNPSWEDVVGDIQRLQVMGRANLQSASLISAYSSVPFTGCGFNKTKSRPESDEDEVYSWRLGVNETLVICPVEDLGHR